MHEFIQAIETERIASGLVDGVFLRDLEGAVAVLWVRMLEGPELEAAMAEIEERTRGQAFRIETSDGPLFLEESLWRYAGRPGNELEDETTAGRSWDDMPMRPTWPTSRREPARLGGQQHRRLVHA